MSMKGFLIKVVDVEGELAMEFPDDLMDTMNLKIGDTLLWVEDNNSWRILKKDTTKEIDNE